MEPPKALVLKLIVFSVCLTVPGSGNRQKYGGRVLNIAPNECTSPKFPNVTGTCMISLECQQRSGTVIGACREGLLFGACCLDANEVVTTTRLPDTVSSTMGSTMQTDSTTTEFQKVPSKNTIFGFLKIQDSKSPNTRNTQKKNTVLVEYIPSDQPTSILVQGLVKKDNGKETTLHSSLPIAVTTLDGLKDQDNSKKAIPVFSSTSKPSVGTTAALRTTFATLSTTTTTIPTTTTTLPTTTTTLPTTTTTIPTTTTTLPTTTTTLPTTTTTLPTTTTTVPSTTKFFYGKIKYSPKPMKFRATTLKTIWTRPPTTETSYSVFTTSEEEDDNEVVRKPVRRVSTEAVTMSTAFSTEAEARVTVPVEEITPIFTKSTEEATAASQQSPEEITTPSAYLKSTEVITAVYHNPTEENASQFQKSTEESTSENMVETTVMPIDIPKTVTEMTDKRNETSSGPQKNVRLVNSPISHRIGAANSENSSGDESSSAGWDNKLDDFVNQVVEGIAEELDKSNIDDVVFKSTSTTSTTTVKPTPKSEKIAIKRKKSKGNGHSNRHHGSSSKSKTKKPTKKVTISKDVNSNGGLLDYKKDCGVRPLARKSRIVGGTPSNYGSWPWHALVKEATWWGMFSKIKCGGVLIGSRHVLTAAHCQPQQTGKLSVVLGVTDSDNPNANAVTKGVRRVLRHPQFNPRTYENDIAVLELDSPVQFQPHIVPICMPDLKEVFEGKEGFVTGMGLLRHDGERPLVLHEVDVPILNNSDCQSMFRRSGNSKPIEESFICAGYPQGLKDSCGGDSGSYPNVPLKHYRSDEPNVNETVTEFFSGGPLSVQRSNGQWVLAGTVSHGIKCAVPNQPGVYMRTTWYRPWIEKVTRVARGRDSSKCQGPPGSCDYPHIQPKGILNTLFRVFRLARKFWKSRK